jgi:Ca2+-binding EF-hand superfamily protein
MKSGVATKTMKDPELIEMFNQMMGASEPDSKIVIPKYDRLMGLCKDFVNMLIKFVKSPIGLAPDNAPVVGQMIEFIKKSQATLAELTLVEKRNKIMDAHGLDAINRDPELMAKFLENVGDRYDIVELGKTYIALKDSVMVQEMLMTAKNIRRLLREEKERSGSKLDDLEDPAKLSARFIVKADGFDVQLLNFAKMNFKHLIVSFADDEKLTQYVLIWLRLIYLKCSDCYQVATSPDIDVEKFSEVLVNSIKDIRKHIPRCDKAFDKIEESVKLLQNNFDGYYKDFIQSQNPGIIIENFVLDVAQDSNSDAQTTLQFRKIISFYKEHMKKSNVKDPKIQKLFEMLGQNLDVLESKNGGGSSGSGSKGKGGKAPTQTEPVEKVPLTEERKQAISDSFAPQSKTTKRSSKSKK